LASELHNLVIVITAIEVTVVRFAVRYGETRESGRHDTAGGGTSSRFRPEFSESGQRVQTMTAIFTGHEELTGLESVDEYLSLFRSQPVVVF